MNFNRVVSVKYIYNSLFSLFAAVEKLYTTSFSLRLRFIRCLYLGLRVLDVIACINADTVVMTNEKSSSYGQAQYVHI